MLETAIKAMLGVTVIMGGWLIVQWLWASATGAAPGEDPLAGRLGCHGCDCQSNCKNEDTNKYEEPSGT